jgi:hypothetical protein
VETLKHALGAHLQRPGRRWCVLMCYGAAKAAPISSPLPYQLGLALRARNGVLVTIHRSPGGSG